MAKRKRKRSNANPSVTRTRAVTPPEAVGVSGGVLAFGILLLALCVATSLMMVLEHWGGLSLPGCGEGSGCAEAAASVWGTVPYLNWPVSFLGLAYFVGLLGVWLSSRRGVAAGVRYLVRFGVLVSAGFIVIMLVEGHLCQYCLGVHGGNIVFWILVERGARTRGGSLRGLAMVTTVFAVSSGVLAIAEGRQRVSAEVKAEEKLEESTEAIIAATSQRGSEPEGIDEPVADDASSQGFTGRYRLGPERAAIRVVLVGDYQCRECRRIEKDVVQLFRQRDDMSVSFKHFPMCSDCNRNVANRRHPNACWAARAAETAGILKGNDGFWEMHFWLFERGGSFTRESFPSQLRELGYDPGEFLRVMNETDTLEPIKADVEEVIGLGVWFTPTIFINGVELRGWEAPKAVVRAIERLAAADPEPLTAAHDQPPAALEKLIGDWRAKPRRTISAGPAFRTRGPEDAAVRVVMFGDYQQNGTAETDALIREVLAQRDDVRYEYRHFPFNRECNPVVKRDTDFAESCHAARAGEAAGRLAGTEAYWKMHAWLLENQEGFSEESLPAAAEMLGIDAAMLVAEMEKPATGDAIETDAALGGRLGADKIPSLFIDERRVPRWKQEDRAILAELVGAAAED